jgi:hypothetical protein
MGILKDGIVDQLSVASRHSPDYSQEDHTYDCETVRCQRETLLPKRLDGLLN